MLHSPDPGPAARSVTVDGRLLAYLEAGDIPASGPAGRGESGDRPTLVVLHGIGSSAQSCLPLLPHLAAHARIIAWDMPGYGGSDPLPGVAPAAEAYVAALAALLDAAGCERVTLLGHSLGAAVACPFTLAYPDRVAALILASPTSGYGAATPEAWPRQLHERLDELRTLGPAAFAAKRSGRLPAPGADPATVAAVEREMARVRLPGYAHACGLLGAADTVTAFGRTTCPATVMVGAQDRITQPESVRRVAAARPDARYLELPGVGHAGYLEDPAAYAAPILAHWGIGEGNPQ